MARKTKVITIEAPSRDQGKRFRITEMSALAQEKWASKAILALLNSGVELPDNVNIEELQGVNGLAKILSLGTKIFAKIAYDKFEPLYSELLTCCEYLGKQGESISTPLSDVNVDEIIEEVKTLLVLRKAVLDLHTDFLAQDGKSN